MNIPFALGRAGAKAAVLQPGNPGSPRIARVPGRAVLDGIDQLKAGFWAFDSFSLDNVAHELLGVGKLISTDSDKVAERSIAGSETTNQSLLTTTYVTVPWSMKFSSRPT